RERHAQAAEPSVRADSRKTSASLAPASNLHVLGVELAESGWAVAVDSQDCAACPVRGTKRAPGTAPSNERLIPLEERSLWISIQMAPPDALQRSDIACEIRSRWGLDRCRSRPRRLVSYRRQFKALSAHRDGSGFGC